MVAIKQGGIAGAAIGGVNKTIDNMVNHSLFLMPKMYPYGEITKESDI
jgi:hypothetical protein